MSALPAPPNVLRRWRLTPGFCSSMSCGLTVDGSVGMGWPLSLCEHLMSCLWGTSICRGPIQLSPVT